MNCGGNLLDDTRRQRLLVSLIFSTRNLMVLKTTSYKTSSFRCFPYFPSRNPRIDVSATTFSRRSSTKGNRGLSKGRRGLLESGCRKRDWSQLELETDCVPENGDNRVECRFFSILLCLWTSFLSLSLSLHLKRIA